MFGSAPDATSKAPTLCGDAHVRPTWSAPAIEVNGKLIRLARTADNLSIFATKRSPIDPSAPALIPRPQKHHQAKGSDMAGKKPKGLEGRDANGHFQTGNKWGYKPGQSGNVGGRPKKSEVLKALDEEMGDAGRMLLVKVLDQVMNGEKHFAADSKMAKEIEKMSMVDIIKLSTYVDEQFNGKATTRNEFEGLSVILGTDAGRA